MVDDEKVHYIAVTGIVRKNGRFLICKRSEKEKAFPNKWCVPGGKVERSDFTSSPKDTKDHWFDIFERVVKKEIMEETMNYLREGPNKVFELMEGIMTDEEFTLVRIDMERADSVNIYDFVGMPRETHCER